MSLLPQELAASDEGRRVLELPTDDIGPLVELERQVAVAADPLGVVRVHHLWGCVASGFLARVSAWGVGASETGLLCL